MNKTRMALGAMALAVLAAFGAWATPVDEATARTAAERFLQTSKMAARTLPERTVVTIAARGNLWVVRLAPSGHILLSGSDRATPIIGFSQNDFSEGEEDSAERAMLDAADAAVAAAEADETKGRHARWDSLLAEPTTSTGKKVRKLLGTGTGTDINIEPFVDSKYNQNQPWNDLTPVTSKDSDYIWRGRSCAGCVSIADAAIYRELEWPKYPARIETVTHNLRGENFAIRFNGSVPFDWSKMSDTYSYSGDMRGKAGAEEDKRYEIGRYVLWLNQSASMSYNQGESTSTKSTSAHGCERDWYTIGYGSGVVTNTEGIVKSDVVEKVTQTLSAGIPVFVGIGGHAVVADGWGVENEEDYVHLVYGYGGNASDKFYNVKTGPVHYFWLDHYPRAKPQLDPIPRVVGNSVTLSWSFPDCYTNSLTGFVIRKKLRTSAALTDWTADFSDLATTGSAYPANVWSTYTFENEDGKVTLNAGDLTYGMYQFSTPLTVTASSVLSLKMRGGANTSGDANKHNIVIEICGEDGNWKELLVPECTWANWPGSWTESTKSLAEYAGQTVQLRIYKRHITYNGRVNIGDFKVTNVIPLEGNDDEQEVAATARSATLTGLTAGADYAFSVVPEFDDNQVVVAGYSVIPEASDEKIAMIAGSHQVPGSSGEVTEDYTTKTAEETSIEFTDSFRITEASQLSFGWTADCVADGSVTLYVYFTPTGGERESIYNITKNYFEIAGMVVLDGSGEYAENVSLESYAGQSGLLEVVIVDAYSNVASSSSVSSALQVTNVTSIGVPESETLTALEMPTFTSIRYAANGGAAADLVDGYLADGAIGSSTLYVTTPVNVTKLTAVPSHVELVKDNNVHVEKVSEGNWEITFDPVIPANRDRQRMILTLNATDTNGTTVHRDVVMRMTEDKIVVGEGKTWTLNDDYELTRSLVLAGGTVTANDTFAINQNEISSFTVVSNSTINGAGKLSISNSNATITFENSKSLTNSLDIESDNEETLTLAGTGTFVQGAGTTIKVYDMSVGEHVLLNLNLTSDQSTSEAIVQFGNGMASITDWKLRIDAPTDMPKGTYPLIYASTYLSKPTTIYLPNLDRECSVEVKNSNTLNFVVGDPKTTQVTNTDYPVPYSWFTDMGVPASYIDTLKNSQTSSGYKWWECYVLGLNPMGSGTFTATLTMDGNTPVITYSPTNETLVADATMPITYVLQGNASTTEDNWENASFDNPGSSYVRFRVDVRWTNDEEVKHIYSNEMTVPIEPEPEPTVAPTPIAVWNKDFNRTVEGCALNWHGNTLGDDRNITITTVDGNEYQGVNVNLANGTNAITVIVKYSGLAYTTDNGRMVFTSCAESTKTTDRTAVRITTSNALSGSWGDNSGVAESGTSAYPGTSVPAASGYMVFCYGNPDDDNNRGTLICSGNAEGNLNTTNFWQNGLRFAADSNNKTIYGATIGGYRKYSTSNGWKNATGMKIEAIAVFTQRLTAEERNAYTFPDPETVTFSVAEVAGLTAAVAGATDNGDGTYTAYVGDTVTLTYTVTGAYVGENQEEDITITADTAATIGNPMAPVQAVAKIGDSYYATYAAAVADYTDGDTIEVLDATAGDIPTGWEITSEGTRLTKIRVTITWSVDGVETPVSVDYGDTPTYDGTPTKAEDAQYTYTFTGWNPAIVVATEAATYTAVFSSTVKEYTITWKNDDDSTIATTVVAYGVTPEYSGETPTKADDAQYTYTFTGWTPAIEAVASNTTYTATYSATPIEVIPRLPDNPTSADVTAAITKAKFTDTGVATIITGAENQVQEYNYFKTWADQIGAADVVASAHAADSYLLGTNALLQNDPVVTINAFNTGATAGAMTLSVTVTDGGTPVEVTPQKVMALIKATKDLSDWDGEGKLTPTLDVSGDKITVSSGSEPVMFLKLKK